MTLTPEQLEWIVSEVVRRLQASAVLAGPSPSVVASQPARDLVLTERLITLKTLEGRLTNIQNLIVPPRAIVTPAVKDELKRRQINLQSAISNLQS